MVIEQEERLIAYVRAGHREAWTIFAQNFYHRTERYCHEVLQVGSHVVSDLWDYLLQNPWDFPETGGIWAWLCDQARRISTITPLTVPMQQVQVLPDRPDPNYEEEHDGDT